MLYIASLLIIIITRFTQHLIGLKYEIEIRKCEWLALLDRGEVGDVVVGRICEVGQKRWKVDAGSCLDCQLQLSSVHLPGGVLRR